MIKNIEISEKIKVGNDLPFVLFAGPCAIESQELGLEIASFLKDICGQLNIPFVFKASIDKANRSSYDSYRGPGLYRGMEILSVIRKKLDVPVMTDIHLPEQAAKFAEVADILQIPAFLCRQTDLILAAAKTGKTINIKKGQFLSPQEMASVCSKISSAGNNNILQCERGTSFGYNNLVVDMRSLEIMKMNGYPVIFDATHSVQLPGACNGKSGGQREFVPILARAAVAVGIAGLFMEVHPRPNDAPCDGPNMLFLECLPSLLAKLKQLDEFIKQNGA